MRSAGLLAALAMCLLQPPAALALEGREVFKLAESSVVVVLASDAKGEKNSQGNGVLIAALDIVTSCNVVESAADIVVTQDGALRKARLQFQDKERDLCQVHIDDPLPAGKAARLAAPGGTLEIGQELYAISYPKGLARAMNRVMIAGLQDRPGMDGKLIALDSPGAGGNDGGGVFDQEARLVGILTPQFKRGESAQFAVPAGWIAGLAKRNPDRLLEATAPAPARTPEKPAADKGPWHPDVGARWRYRILDGQRPVGQMTIEVIRASSGQVSERITKEGSPGFSAERNVDAGFNPMKYQDVVTLPGGYQFAELAPYLPPGQDIRNDQLWNDLPVTLLLGGYGYGKQKFQTQARVIGREKVRVPAGEFDAVHVQSTGRKNLGSDVIKITCNYWYSPASMRTVKMSLDMKYSNSSFTPNSETYELVSAEGPR